MSELTPCNYCNLQNYEWRAKKNNEKLTLLSGWRGGKDVYIHPKEIDIEKLSEDNRKEYFVAWLMEISKHCVC